MAISEVLKAVLIPVVWIAILTTPAACKKKKREGRAETAQDLAVRQEIQRQQFESVAQRLVYFRDARTDTCFAYWYETLGYGHGYSGGPGLATVDCAKIPPGLLANRVILEAPQEDKRETVPTDGQP